MGGGYHFHLIALPLPGVPVRVPGGMVPSVGVRGFPALGVLLLAPAALGIETTIAQVSRFDHCKDIIGVCLPRMNKSLVF
jgi:hypothetical protein